MLTRTARTAVSASPVALLKKATSVENCGEDTFQPQSKFVIEATDSRGIRGADMEPLERTRSPLAYGCRAVAGARAAFVLGCGVSAGWLSAIADARAQTVAEPVTRQEVAPEEIAAPAAKLPLYVLPPQSNMREVRWSELTGWDNSQIPAFFRDSLVQVVARS